MELRQLVYLDAVVRHGGFTRAAERLRVAQPAVSAQIRRLESELGTVVLERTTRRVRLTKAGELVLARARRALDEVAGISADLGELAGGLRGRVRIGSIQEMSSFDLPAALAGFCSQHPLVELSLRSGWLHDLIADLDADHIDLAIGPVDDTLPERIAATPLLAEELVLVVPSDHPLSLRHDLSLADLRDQPFVCLPAGTGLRRILDWACATVGFEPTVRYEATSLYQLRGVVANGIAAALVTRSVAESGRPSVSIHQPLDTPIEQEIGLLHLRDRRLAPAAERCYDLLTHSPIRGRPAKRPATETFRAPSSG